METRIIKNERVERKGEKERRKKQALVTMTET